MSTSGPLGDRVVTAAYPSFYVTDLGAAEAFYEGVLGPTEFREGEGLVGFRLGSTWLTLFRASDGPSPDSGPRGAEFAIEVKTPADVDELYARLLELGAKPLEGFAPTDTWMYQPMRFACVDDPFGIRIDVFCPLPAPPEGSQAPPASSP